MKFDFCVGNPPYQEQIANDEDSNSSLSKQLFPLFVQGAIEMGAKHVALITPSRWFVADAQDKSFVKLREFIKSNNHIKALHNFRDAKEVFPNTEIAGGVSYFLYDAQYTGKVKFVGSKKTEYRNLFEEGLDIIISDGDYYSILSKVQHYGSFKSLMDLATGRNAFGVVGKKSELEKTTKTKPFTGSVEVFCAHEEKRYIDRSLIKKNVEIIDKWKIFTSKGNGGAGILTEGKKVAILGKSFVGQPNSICTDSLIPIGCFDSETEAINLQKYMTTKFLRFMVGILKSSQNIYQVVYRFVPVLDFTNESDIDWDKSISEIDKQIYAKFGLSDDEVQLIESLVKEME